MPPQILEDRFQIESQLSHTDFITVYLARDRHYLHRPHCIVKAVSYRQDKMRHRIEREVHTLERLGAHPQIPRVLAYFHATASGQAQADEARTFYIAQDLIDGHPVSEEILADKPLSESYASKLLKDVLVPLSSTHSQGVVHQNLHPQSLIRQSQDGQIFLTEFGTLPKLARSVLDDKGGLSSSIPVSPAPYSAPEQLLQNPQPASDLYALGLIAIEALTGRRHQDLSFDPVKGILWRDLVTQGEGLEGKVSLSLAEFIDRLVRRRWEDRFENASEALSQLKIVRDRNQIANDSRFPTAIAAPGKQATAFSHTVSNIAAGSSGQNNLPYPLNLAVRSPAHSPKNTPAGYSARSSTGGAYSGSTKSYAVSKSNPYLFKLAIGSIATILAVGISVKTYQWGEYRISRLPQSWSDWALGVSDASYPTAAPNQLVPLFADGSLLVRPAAAKAYWQMAAAAETEGVKLYALSGYRAKSKEIPPPIDTQEPLPQTEVAEPAKAEADYHTGYALDIGGESEDTDRQQSFAKTAAYKWLQKNASSYGFALSGSASPLKRGLLGTASNQPWHWRYVGDEESQAIFGLSTQQVRDRN